MPASSISSISKEKPVRRKDANPVASNSGNAAKFPKNSYNSADVSNTTFRRKSDIPVASNPGNSTKFSKKTGSSLEERQNFSLLRSKTPTRSQSKRAVQPKNVSKNLSDQKTDDKSKNSNFNAKNKTINFFNSRESCQAKENETRSHLSQKESGATRKAPLYRNSLSKNNSCSVSKPIPVSKEGKPEKCVEARRTVYPKKIEPNKSILRGISKSDLNLNIDLKMSEEKNANKNFRKVPNSVFESGMKKVVSFKNSSANDLNKRRNENAVKTNAEERSICEERSKLKMPFYEEYDFYEEQSESTTQSFQELLASDSFFEERSLSNEQLTVPEKYEQLFTSKDNKNCNSSLNNTEKIATYNNGNNIKFNPAVDEKVNILTDAHETRTPFYDKETLRLKRRPIAELLSRNKTFSFLQLNAFSQNINNNDQGNVLSHSVSPIKKDEHSDSEISVEPLIEFEETTEEYFRDLIARRSQNVDEYYSGERDISEDYTSNQMKKFQYCYSETDNDKISFETQCLVEEEKSKQNHLAAASTCIPVESNNETVYRTEFISSDPIPLDNSSSSDHEKTTLKELSKRELIEKSIEEKLRILKIQFLKQIKEQNKNYYIFQKKIEQSGESCHEFVNNLLPCNTNYTNQHIKNIKDELKSTVTHDSINEKSENYALNNDVILYSSDAVHCYGAKKNKSSLSNLLLNYYDQHIKSPSAFSKTSHPQPDTLLSPFSMISPETFTLSKQVEGTDGGFQNLTQNHEECKDTNSSKAKEFLKSTACEVQNSENCDDIFNELDSARKFDEFFGKAVIDEDTLKEILDTYFVDGNNNSLNQLKQSEAEETRIGNCQNSNGRKTNSIDSYVFKRIPIATIIFILFACIIRYFTTYN